MCSNSFDEIMVIHLMRLCFLLECLSPSALRRVSRKCHGRTNCSVLADAQGFGDPCFPGTRKHLRVSFTCGEFQEVSKKYDHLIHC